MGLRFHERAQSSRRHEVMMSCIAPVLISDSDIVFIPINAADKQPELNQLYTNLYAFDFFFWDQCPPNRTTYEQDDQWLTYQYKTKDKETLTVVANDINEKERTILGYDEDDWAEYVAEINGFWEYYNYLEQHNICYCGNLPHRPDLSIKQALDAFLHLRRTANPLASILTTCRYSTEYSVSFLKAIAKLDSTVKIDFDKGINEMFQDFPKFFSNPNFWHLPDILTTNWLKTWCNVVIMVLFLDYRNRFREEKNQSVEQDAEKQYHVDYIFGIENILSRTSDILNSAVLYTYIYNVVNYDVIGDMVQSPTDKALAKAFPHPNQYSWGKELFINNEHIENLKELMIFVLFCIIRCSLVTKSEASRKSLRKLFGTDSNPRTCYISSNQTFMEAEGYMMSYFYKILCGILKGPVDNQYATYKLDQIREVGFQEHVEKFIKYHISKSHLTQ